MPIAIPEFEPITNPSFPNVYGSQLTWLTGGLTLLISDGQALDSTGQFVMSVNTFGVGTTLNTAEEGVNGLDVLPLQNTLYAVYMIADAAGFNPTAFIASTNITNTPVMPTGYSLIRRIGWFIASAGAILEFFQTGLDNTRTYQYAAAVLVLAAGIDTSFAAVNITAAVPPINFALVTVNCEFGGTIGDTIFLKGVDSNTFPANTNPVVMTATLTGTQNFPPVTLTAGILGTMGMMSINYAVSAGTLEIHVTRYTDYL